MDQVSTTATADFVLDTLEQTFHARKPGAGDGLIRHSGRQNPPNILP